MLDFVKSRIGPNRIVIIFQALALIGIILPLFWLDSRVEYDDAWFTISGYEWALNGLPRIPAFINSPGGDDHLHLLWLSVSGVAAIGIKLLSGYMSIISSARLPMVVASAIAIIMLGVRGSKFLGQVPAWCGAAFLSLDSMVFLNARTVRPEALLLPIFVWVLLQLIAIIKEQALPKDIFLVSIVLGIAALTLHPNAIIIPGCLMVAALFSPPKKMIVIKTAIWCSIGIILGLILYSSLISYVFSDFSHIKTYLVGDTLIGSNQSIMRHHNYVHDVITLLSKWSVFPYRGIIFICILFSVIAGRKEPELQFLVISAFMFLILYTILRGSANVRYMAYTGLLLSPVIGTAYANRHKIFDPLWANIFTLVLFITLLSGFGNIIETFRTHSNTAVIKSILKTDIPKDGIIISSLWIGGIAPERGLILDLYAAKHLRAGTVISKDEKYYYVEDGLNGDPWKIKEIFRENGFNIRIISEHNMLPRLKYLHVYYLTKHPQ